MKKSLALLFLLAVASAPGLLRAYGSAGTVGAPYLELPMGARGEAMGEAFTGVANDVNSIYYNPAGLTALDTAQLELMNIQGFGGIQYENIGLAVPADLLGVNVWGTLGVSYTLIGVDNTPVTGVTPSGAEVTTPYTYTAGSSVLTLSYAWQATQMFSVGATVKLLSDKVATFQGEGVAGDIGVKTTPGLIDGLSAGVDLENFGTSPEPASTLPTDLRMGLGYDWASANGADTVLVDTDMVMPVVPVDEVWQLDVGGEYTHSIGEIDAALRAGYRTPQPSLGPDSGVSLGGGIGAHLKGMDLSLDYAWIPYGELGSMQRIALTMDLGETPGGRQMGGPRGDYIYPPKNVVAQAGSHSARVSWDPQTGKVDGYNLYMSYNPSAKQWTRLNKRPLTGTSMSVRNLYNGYKVYFCVSTLARKAENLYRESDKSETVAVTPR